MQSNYKLSSGSKIYQAFFSYMDLVFRGFHTVQSLLTVQLQPLVLQREPTYLEVLKRTIILILTLKLP